MTKRLFFDANRPAGARHNATRAVMVGTALAIMLAAGVALAQPTLTITSWGGAYSQSQRLVYFDPFTKATGIRIRDDEWDGSVARIQTMVERRQVTWDVVDVLTPHALQGCEEGWLEKIDYGKLGGKAAFVDGAAMECAVGTAVYSTVYAYNADRFPQGGPVTAADFWDIRRFPGPRAMQKSPRTTLEFALIADGVPAREVYNVLATPAGVERAFRKLDRIKPYVKVWWTAGAQPVQLLASGEVAMSTAWNGRIHDAVKHHGKNFRIVWDGQAMDFDLWAIPKGSRQAGAATDFIAFASRPDIMSRQSAYLGYAPTTKAAMSKLPPDVLRDLPTAPQNSRNAYVMSARFWADHDQDLTERFNQWLARP